MALDVYKEWLGIPDGQRPPDHYQLLRLVQFEDTPDRIRGNYKKLNAHVRKYASGAHAAESQDLLNELAKAMLCLTDLERKREYDESQGREFEDELDSFGRQPLEKVLVDQEHITKEQMKETVDFAEARGLSMRDAVVQMRLVDVETAAQALAAQLGYSFVDLGELVPDDSVLDGVPRNLVKRNQLLPLFIDDDRLLVACIDEPEPELEEELRLRFGVPVRWVIATPLAINQGLAQYYAPGMRDEATAQVASADGAREKKKTKEKPSGPRMRFSQLSSGEQQHRKQMGLLMICWGIIIPVMLDEFFLKKLLPNALVIPFVPSITTLLVSPSVIWYVLKVYWK